MRSRKAAPDREPSRARESTYAQDVAATEAAQAAYFREQADRHRRAVERERAFASLADYQTGREHEARARHFETWASQAEAVANALETGRRRN